MNKKTITIIIVLIILLIAILILNKKYSTPEVTDIPARNDTVTTLDNSTTTTKSYSLSEVALHNKASDCWMAIDGKVINPTAFIAAGLHPNDNILSGCGLDASSMFAQVRKHDGGRAQAALKQYEIGVLK